MANQRWTCPYCNLAQVTTDNTTFEKSTYIKTQLSTYGYLWMTCAGNVCANAACKEFTLMVQAHKVKYPDNDTHREIGEKIGEWNLRPMSMAKPQPAYIPSVITADYMEACAIRDLSPKASATLSRRCIQGMIRDFCGISKSRLVEEIEALAQLVSEGKAPNGVHADAVEAIDHVRKIGNIGAHMERDINVIVDVDPAEAQLLINLIELLFAEWYVAREVRSSRLKSLMQIAEGKKPNKAATA